MLVGSIADPDRGEVRLPRPRTHAGELGRRHAHFVVPVRMGVRHDLQGLRRSRRHAPIIRSFPAGPDAGATRRAPSPPRALKIGRATRLNSSHLGISYAV